MRHVVAERIGGKADAGNAGFAELRRYRDDYTINLTTLDTLEGLTDDLVRLAGLPPGLRVLNERAETCSALPSL